MEKRLYIIGNGFDLAHGFETSLCSFRNYLQGKDGNSRKFLNALQKYVPLNITWSNFEEALGRLQFEDIYDDCSCYLKDTASDNWRDSAWDDFGYEISKAVAFSSDISTYMKEWIRSVRIDSEYKFPIKEDSLFLSFNYTNTLEKLYAIPKYKIAYIHGDCSTEEDLICGHNDKSLLKEKLVPESNYSYQYQEAEMIRQEYFQTTWKNPSVNIQKHRNFFNKLNTIEKIVVIGHSFENKIDDEYFAYVKRNINPNCKWKISYYSNADKINNNSFVKRLDIKDYHFFMV